MRRLDVLQAGRGIAALAVVLHHANLAARDFGGRHFDWLSYGQHGVDFFFVLSGFIIAHTIDGKSLGEYSWHRFRRVVLPYLPIGVGVAALYTVFPTVSAGDRPWNWFTSLTLFPYGEPALSVAWTLQHEVTFYAIFALAYFTRQRWILLVWGALCLLGSDLIPLRAYNLEFLLGVGIRMLWSGQGQWQMPRPFTFLGDASYSVYLAHGIAISIVARIYPNLAVLVCAGVTGGLAYFFIVERPILRHVRKRPSSKLLSTLTGGQSRPDRLSPD